MGHQVRSITIVIPTPADDLHITAGCVKSLLRRGHTDIRLMDWRGSFARTVNEGLAGARTEFVGCVNNDTVAPPQWGMLLTHGTLSCPLESTQPGYDDSRDVREGPQGFFGGFWVMPTVDWEELGGMDEDFEPYYCEDTDLLYRAEKAGLLIVRDERVAVQHLQNWTIRHDPDRDAVMRKNVELFRTKHGFDPIKYQHA